MEAERCTPRRAERGAVVPRRLQQSEGADDIGLDECGRAVDRAIDMAFGRKMHHRVGLMRREDLPHRRGVGDVGADQHVPVVAARFLQRILRCGIGQLVDVDHHVIGMAHQMAHHGGTDEAASAGQQEFHPAGAQSLVMHKNRQCTDPVRERDSSGLCRSPSANGKRVYSRPSSQPHQAAARQSTTEPTI